jgi:hypothetical protein
MKIPPVLPSQNWKSGINPLVNPPIAFPKQRYAHFAMGVLAWHISSISALT